MGLKLCLLKSGESVIANVEEMHSSNDILIGYFFDRPFVTKIGRKVDSADGDDGYRIGISPWIPLTRDRIITVPLDWVITMVDPVETLVEIYSKGVWGKTDDDKNNSSSEQSDTDISD